MYRLSFIYLGIHLDSLSIVFKWSKNLSGLTYSRLRSFFHVLSLAVRFISSLYHHGPISTKCKEIGHFLVIEHPEIPFIRCSSLC